MHEIAMTGMAFQKTNNRWKGGSRGRNYGWKGGSRGQDEMRRND